MKSIMSTYPDFRILPRGIKQLLLAFKSLFFDEAKPELPMVPKINSQPVQALTSLPAGMFGNKPREPAGEWGTPTFENSLAAG